MNRNTQNRDKREDRPAPEIGGKREQTADKSFFGASQQKKEFLKNLGKQ